MAGERRGRVDSKMLLIDGALLVRPDQHVAWESTRLPAVAGESLITASTSILGYSMGGS